MRGSGSPIIKSLGTMMPTALTRSSAPPTPIVSNAPTAFYRQHHVVEAPAIDEREFRPAWRVKTKLMLLVECARIDRRQLEAAAAFKAGARPSAGSAPRTWLGLRVDGGRWSDGLVTEWQLDAARRLRDAGLALGNERAKLLIWTLVDDRPWTEIGKRLGLSKTATGRAVEAIAALALWRADQPVPPAPVTRSRIEPDRW
jgi:hypothetical protein